MCERAASSSGGIVGDSLIGFGVCAPGGGILTAAIMRDDDDENGRLYCGGRGFQGAPSDRSQPNEEGSIVARSARTIEPRDYLLDNSSVGGLLAVIGSR